MSGARSLSERLWEVCKAVSASAPLVQCITNIVTVNDCANVLLAAGAHPIMASHPDEVEEIQQSAGALVLNLGAIAQALSMRRAAEAAKRAGHPVVVDPVGVAASSVRRKFCLELLADGLVTCVRGNGSELRALLSGSRTAAGLEASSADSAEAAEVASELARRFGCLFVASGAVDRVCDGQRLFSVANGDAMMTLVTGTGCMSSALMGAFLAAGNEAEAAAACCAAMGIAGESAAEKTRLAGGGPGTFRVHLIDGVYLTDEAYFTSHLKCYERAL